MWKSFNKVKNFQEEINTMLNMDRNDSKTATKVQVLESLGDII